MKLCLLLVKPPIPFWLPLLTGPLSVSSGRTFGYWLNGYAQAHALPISQLQSHSLGPLFSIAHVLLCTLSIHIYSYRDFHAICTLLQSRLQIRVMDPLFSNAYALLHTQKHALLLTLKFSRDLCSPRSTTVI